MPLRRILPNGQAEIFNTKTGEVKVVNPSELSAYNPALVDQYQKMGGGVSQSQISDNQSPTFQGNAPFQANAQPNQYVDLIKKYFPQDQWDNAVKVMMGESGGNPAAVGDNYPIAGQTIPSYGLFQIRALQGRPDPSILTNPEENVKYAAEMYKNEGWGPWTAAQKLGIVNGPPKAIVASPAPITAEASFGNQPTFQSGESPFAQEQTQEIGAGNLPKDKAEALRKDLLRDIQKTGGKNKAAIEAYYQTYKLSDEEVQGIKNQKVKLDFNKTNVDNAKAILDLMEKKKKGLIDDTAFNTELRALASKQAAHIGFGIGGKVLSEGEKAILQPQMANMAKSKTVQKGNIIQRGLGWFSGSPVPQTEISKEVLADTPDQLTQKMQSIINIYGNEQDKQNYLNKDYALGTTTKTNIPGQEEGFFGFKGNPIENAANEVKNIATSAFDYLTTEHPNQTLNIFDFSKENPITAAAKQIPEIGKSLAQTVGFGVKEDGSISWDPTDILRHAWNSPVETAAWLMMFKDVAPLKGVKKVPEKVAGVGKKAIEGTLEATTGGGTKELIAKNVLKDQAESLNKTLLDHDIYKYSDKGRIEATQKALIDEGSNLASKIQKSTKTINSNIVNRQIDKILKANGVNDQAVATQIKQILADQGLYNLQSNSADLSMTNLWEMAKKADEFGPRAFNLPNIGPQMKSLTKDISKYLRSYISDKVPEAIPNFRAYANLKTYMDDILKDPAGLKVKGSMSLMNALANITNTFIGKPLETIGQKTYNLLENIAPAAKTPVTVESPGISGATFSQGGVDLSQVKGAVRQPLPQAQMSEIMSKVETAKPTQSSRLVRDMRYKQGNWHSRAMQERVLRSAKKIKYK